MLLFTTHALKRMRERKITRAEVTATVKKSEAMIWEESKVAVYRKKHGVRTLEVVTEIQKSKYIVITTYWI